MKLFYCIHQAFLSPHSSDRVFIGPSPNHVRAVDVEADVVFDLGVDDALEAVEPKRDGVKPHDMTKIHLDIYKG